MAPEVASPTEDPANARAGAVVSIVSALLFGLSAPLAKRLLGTDTDPVLLAGLFYLGAGIGLSIRRLFVRPSPERALRPKDARVLVSVIILGGILGPALMMLGLEQVDATPGSLLLNLETPLTMLIAVVIYGERLTLRTILSALLIIGGAAVIGLPRDASFGASPTGIFYLAGACLVWAIDTNLMRILTRRDPFAVSRMKTLWAGCVNVLAGLALESWRVPAASILVAAMIVGFFSYGVSTVLVSMSLKRIGAARHAAFFATAPFFGAIAAIPLLGEHPSTPDYVAMGLMALGVAILFLEGGKPPRTRAGGATMETR